VTILFDATRRVKTTRRFGSGILASRPTFTRTHSEADEAWLAEDNARRDSDRSAHRNARLEWVAGCAIAADRLANGCCL